MSQSQREKVLEYLKIHGEITVKEAIYELGITQAATRIKELIELDHEPISRDDWKEVVKKDGTTTRVKVYRYHPRDGQQSLGFGSDAPKNRHQRFGDPV